MIDHVSIAVKDLVRSRDFYKTAFLPLGYEVIYDIEDVAGWNAGITGASLGENGETRIWLDGDTVPAYTHLAVAAVDRQAVDAWYQAALSAGGEDNGAPGVREMYGPNYYAAFVKDPDGNNIEVVCRSVTQ